MNLKANQLKNKSIINDLNFSHEIIHLISEKTTTQNYIIQWIPDIYIHIKSILQCRITYLRSNAAEKWV